MTPLRHTPYDGSSTPFTIGLTQIDAEQWIETDGDLGDYLAEKDRLLAHHFDDVFQETEGSRAAQQEALEAIAQHLLHQPSGIYRQTGETIACLDRAIALEAAKAPLLTAGSLVADDLVILENRHGDWRVTAGYVSFPSSWSLKEKAGLTIGEVHGPVPDFETGSRNDQLITRMFDKIQPDRIVERFNWSIYPDGDLFWSPEMGAKAASRPFDPLANFIRVERQTLRKLPTTGAILFTIRIYRDPVPVIAAHRTLAETLAHQLETMTPAQLAYKGMSQKYTRLVEALRRF